MSDRAPASRDDLCTVAEVARRLGIGEEAAREWLDHWGLLRPLSGLEGRGRRWVLWGDVIDMRVAPPTTRRRKGRGTVGDDAYVDPES